jgi:uncharacterized membrane protein
MSGGTVRASGSSGSLRCARGPALALKALPLACLWWPLARGNRRARQAASLILPLYAGEGIVRALTEPSRYAYAAGIGTVLAVAALVAILQSFRAEAISPT